MILLFDSKGVNGGKCQGQCGHLGGDFRLPLFSGVKGGVIALDSAWEDRGLVIGLFVLPVNILGLKPIIQELKDQAIQGTKLVAGNPV